MVFNISPEDLVRVIISSKVHNKDSLLKRVLKINTHNYIKVTIINAMMHI